MKLVLPVSQDRELIAPILQMRLKNLSLAPAGHIDLFSPKFYHSGLSNHPHLFHTYPIFKVEHFSKLPMNYRGNSLLILPPLSLVHAGTPTTCTVRPISPRC